MKNIVSIIGGMFMAVIMFACTTTTPLQFNPGVYTGTGIGYNGPIKLKVTFSEKAITDIAVESSRETAHIGDVAFPIMFENIKAFTSTGVDIVSGATFTSLAVLAAVEDAVSQAGWEPDDLRKGVKEFAYKPEKKITETYDVVIVGAGGAGMMAGAAAAQAGASVIILEKMAEIGGNTIASGGQYQSAEPSLAWEERNPDAVTAIAPNGKTVTKNKMDRGRLETLRWILTWKESVFDETVADVSAIKSIDDYDLPNRGVHQDYLPTLQELKRQITAYLAWAEPQLRAGSPETDLTLFSTPELHIFQTYYGGLRLSADGRSWIVNDFKLVEQFCRGALEIKPWLAAQGADFDYDRNFTLIGCLWQRENEPLGGTVNGVTYARPDNKWGTYFKVPENTILTANPKNKIMTRTTVTGLIANASGRITGVKGVRYDGTEVEITANKGVILATGGYGANTSMVLETNTYWDTRYLLADIKTTNRSLSKGEGITMAQALGADVIGMGWTQLMPLGWVDNGNLAFGTGENVIYISPAGTPNAGRRYVNEAAERDTLSLAAFVHGGAKGLFVEIGNPKNVPFQILAPGPHTSADNIEGRLYFCTLPEAAALLKIDETVLRQTITEYDNYIIGRSGTPSQPVKTAYQGTIGDCEQDAQGNYLPNTYRLDQIAVRYMAPSTHHTMGGLRVDTDRHVLNTQGVPIPGLYAAGEVTGGFHSGNRLGGNAIVEIIVSGRVAGTAAATGR
jgi:fumarate reductase flavoprotein subunit